jgi:hypothetical protein
MKIVQYNTSFLLLFVVTGVVLYAAEAVPIYPTVASGACNFTLTVSPTSTSVARGSYVVFGISVKSGCGTDHIAWGPFVSSPTPTVTCDKNGVCTSDGPVLHQSSYHTIGSGGGSFTAGATQTTLLTTWTITVTASDVTHCCVSRSETVTLTVDDFTVTANPTSVRISAGQTAYSTITAAGVNGFTGTIYYSGNYPSAATTGIACNLQPDPVTISTTAISVTSSLSCNGTPGSYTVILNASPYNGSPVRSATVAITIT